MDAAAERERRVRKKWEHLSWSHVAVAVTAAAAGMGAIGYVLHGWRLALAAGVAVGLGLTAVLVPAMRHPDQIARGERPRSMKVLSAGFLALTIILGLVAAVTGDWRAAARLIPALILIAFAHLVRRRLRARRTVAHARRDSEKGRMSGA
jgi:Kef-type K+ transport system membrane component KefB